MGVKNTYLYITKVREQSSSFYSSCQSYLEVYRSVYLEEGDDDDELMLNVLRCHETY